MNTLNILKTEIGRSCKWEYQRGTQREVFIYSFNTYLLWIYYILDTVIGAEYTAMNKKELWYFRRPWFSTLWNKCIHFWCLYITLWLWKCSLSFKNNANSIQIPLTVWEPAEGSGDSFPCDYAIWFNKSSTLYLLSLSEHPVGRRAGIHHLSMKKPGSERSSGLSEESQLVSGKTGAWIHYQSWWKYFQLSHF